MADDDTATSGQEPEGQRTETQTTETTTTTQEPEAQREPWDEDRARRTIDKLRTFEKQAKEQAKRLAEYEKREREAEQAKLSEQERLQAQLKERETELERERAARGRTLAQYEVRLASMKLGVVDDDAAVKLLDWDAVEYDDSGKPTNVESALKALIKERPYLAAPTQTTPQRATSAGNPATRAPSGSQRVYTQAEIGDYAFYTKNRDDIIRAMKEGRIEA